jgi:hypothetical protein
MDERHWQKNPLWSTRPLGTREGSTIGAEGCLLSCAARILSRSDRGRYCLDPWSLNRWLVAHNGYEDGNNLVYRALEEASGYSLKFLERRDYSHRSFPLEDEAALIALLKEGGEVLVEVDFDPLERPGQQEHWLCLSRIDPPDRFTQPYGRWLAYDPWVGDVVDVGNYYAPYGRGLDYAVWGLALYEAGKGTVAE